MDTEEILILSIFIISFIAAGVITWRIWPSIKGKLERSRWGRLVLGIQIPHGSKLVFLVHTLVWGMVMFFMLLLWAAFAS